MIEEDMEQIAAPHDTKAAKIRALHDAGVDTASISRFLGIRYQHTYNVLLRAKRVGQPTAEPVDASDVIALDVNPDGELLLPDAARALLGVENGGRLFCRQTSDGVLLMTREVAVDQLQRLARQRMPEHAALLDAVLNQERITTADSAGGITPGKGTSP